SPVSPCHTAATRAVSPGCSSLIFRSEVQANIWSGARLGGTNGIADGLVIDSADQRTRPATASGPSPPGGSPGWTTWVGGASRLTSCRRSQPPPCQKTMPAPVLVAVTMSWTGSPARTWSVESWSERTTPWSSVERDTGAPSTGGGAVTAAPAEGEDDGEPAGADGLAPGAAPHAVRTRMRPL